MPETPAPGKDAPLLAFETSGRTLGLALWGSDGLRAERQVRDGARHGAALAPLTLELLRDAGLKVQDLAAIGVSLGPGSWTGLRIGLAAAKAMAWGAGVALVGVPSLEALALAALRPDRHSEIPGQPGQTERRAATPTVLTVRHAYSEGLYAALWRETSTGPERLLPEGILQPDALPGRIGEVLKSPQARSQVRVRLCGDEVCLTALAEAAKLAGWELLPGMEEIPAAALAERAWARLAAGQAWRSAGEIHAAAPLYLRASDPELRWQRKHVP